jgi:PX domain
MNAMRLRSAELRESRYSEFDELREQLISAFPHTKTALPPLPPKSMIREF